MNNLIVPHIKQSEPASCGAAALSMVYQYLGKDDQAQEIIWERLKEPRPNITNGFYIKTNKLINDSKEQGFSYFVGKAVLLTSDLALQPIKEFLSLSIPVIVCQKISKENRLGHFRVVTGINGNNIILNDPINDTAGTIVSIEDFLNLWEDAGNGEVIGGEFLSIFKKEQIKKDNKFTVYNFRSSIKYFDATSLEFT